jgi:hypothetical protein
MSRLRFPELTFALGTVQAFSERLGTIPRGPHTSCWPESSKVLRLINNLVQTFTECLEQKINQCEIRARQTARTFVNKSDMSFFLSSNLGSNLFRVISRERAERDSARYISIMVRPKPYHNPPAPTRLARRTLQGSALRAFRTLLPNAGGMIMSAQSLTIYC